jgi:hypothetical protein
MTTLNRTRWWTFEVADSTELCDIINRIELIGADYHSTYMAPTGRIGGLFRMMVNEHNLDVAKALDAEQVEWRRKNAAKENDVSSARVAVAGPAQASVPVGKRRGNR